MPTSSPVAPLADASFIDLGVPEAMATAMATRGVTAPFPIQASTIPDALAGRDICGRAPTGSGKTIAFGIPMVLGIGRANPKRPRGLVLVPTRELASQVCRELQLLAKPKGPWVEAFYGGVGFDRQLSALKRGVDIAVCCPGRLADLVNRRSIDLRDVEFVVVDEADRMADMGFLPEVRRLLDQCNTTRQTLLFSATLDGDVDVLIREYQTDPVRHEYGPAEGEVDSMSKADHFFWNTDRTHRLALTASIIHAAGPTVVFCRTKRGADRVLRMLEDKGVRGAAIHGDRSQAAREKALRSFHKGEVRALIATDVAARGIHVDGVACVVHYDPPADHKDYVHRSGRTARAGAAGVVVTLVTSDQKKEVARLQRALGYESGFSDADPGSLAPAGGLAAFDEAAAAKRAVRSSVAEAVESLEQGNAHRKAPRPERSRDRDRGVRAERSPRTERTERTERPPRSDHSDRPVRNDRTDRPVRSDRSTLRARTDGPPSRGYDDRAARERFADGTTDRPARPARTERPAERAWAERTRVERDERPPLEDGQRRPSGAARRKAKKANVSSFDDRRGTAPARAPRSARPDRDRDRDIDDRPRTAPARPTSGRPSAGARKSAPAAGRPAATSSRTPKRGTARPGPRTSTASGTGAGRPTGTGGSAKASAGKAAPKRNARTLRSKGSAR